MSFDERVRIWEERTRSFLAAKKEELPGWLMDQAKSAVDDANQVTNRLYEMVKTADPDGGYQADRSNDVDKSIHVYAMVRAAIDGHKWCDHLRSGYPQIATCRLAARRVDCERCVKTVVSAAAENDQCDWCGARGITGFTPVVLQVGMFVVSGDACDDCVDRIGHED